MSARRHLASGLLAFITGLLVTWALAGPAFGMRKIAPEIGYVIASQDDYGPGFEYGLSVVEGTGRYGWGFTLLGHSESSMWLLQTKEAVYRHEDEISTRRLTLLGIRMIGDQEAGPLWIVGLGPQIYFLKGVRTHLDQGYSESVRENRLGIGVLGRYERPLPALGRTTFVITALLSWMESSSPTLDPYQIPTEAVTSGSITVGLAFSL